MRLIIGLGNPSEGLRNTRHNAGFFVIDGLQKKKLKDFVLKKSDVFMNNSGSFVKSVVSKYPNLKLSDLYIVHDDLDIPLGSFKIQFGKGPKDHNGIKSIDDELGTSAYWHIRVGVDNRNPDNRPPGEDYVLQDFTDEERQILDKTIKTICKKLATS